MLDRREQGKDSGTRRASNHKLHSLAQLHVHAGLHPAREEGCQTYLATWRELSRRSGVDGAEPARIRNTRNAAPGVHRVHRFARMLPPCQLERRKAVRDVQVRDKGRHRTVAVWPRGQNCAGALGTDPAAQARRYGPLSDILCGLRTRNRDTRVQA